MPPRTILHAMTCLGGMSLIATVPYQAVAQQLFTSNDPLSSSQIFAPRALNYWPEGGDFVTVNGRNRFTRALYGGNTGFRVETSDSPEFALYMPNMGGNVLLTICHNNDTVQADVECRYRPGHRLYRITLPQQLAASRRVTPVVELDVVAAYDRDAALWQVRTTGVARGVTLHVRYGAATNDRFSREGDMGVDKKDCFDFTTARCRDNRYTVTGTRFSLNYGSMSKRGARDMVGYFPTDARLTLCDATQADGHTEGSYLTADIPLESGRRGAARDRYFMIGLAPTADANSVVVAPAVQDTLTADYDRRGDATLRDLYNGAEADAAKVAESIRIETPDPFFNTLGGAMAMAADAIWGEEGVWLHGSIGWRMPLPGWRAAYTGDVVGRHDRARIHFDNYAASQLVGVQPTMGQPAQDSALHLARGLEKKGTPMYSEGYICRMPNSTSRLNHYDMNLVYVDELLWHLRWTGDLDYALRMWPTLTRHLSWEQRNFDPDGDGLYDAYCCIWASDALYYSGSAVTHSSAYNYRANLLAAEIATLLDRAVGEGRIAAPEGESYAAQAEHYQAVADRTLAAMNARLWMPHKGVWAEYEDALGLRRLHEAPAVWTVYHAIDSETATPRQAYAATRYVDREIPHIPLRVQTSAAAADAATTATTEAQSARAAYAADIAAGDYATISTTNWQPYAWSINNVALAEVAHTALAYWQAGRNDAGFKLMKSALLDAMYLGASPGNFGQISYYDAARSECYRDFGDPVGITSRALVQGLFGVRPDRLNDCVTLEPGFPSDWDHASIRTSDYTFAFRTDTLNDAARTVRTTYTYKPAADFATYSVNFRLKAQGGGVDFATINGDVASYTYLTEAVETPMVEVHVTAKSECELIITWQPATEPLTRTGEVSDDAHFERVSRGAMSWWMPVDEAQTADVDLGNIAAANFEAVDTARLEMVDLTPHFNERVTEIFHQQYLSPRAAQTTLALPTQGFGEWCHPLDTFHVDDSYLRHCGRAQGYMPTPMGVTFRTPAEGRNVLFTSQWDNFPTSATVPLTGCASHIYLMMAGSTNAMQSRIANGVVRVHYADGTVDSLQLVNPETWWPIEQDYLDGTPTFYLRREAPYRQCLASERCYRPAAKTLNKRIEGGAATLLDLPVRPDRVLQSLEVETLSNDVVIGLLSVTLQR